MTSSLAGQAPECAPKSEVQTEPSVVVEKKTTVTGSLYARKQRGQGLSKAKTGHGIFCLRKDF